MRLFVAVELPSALRASLRDLQERLREAGAQKVRWTRPEGIHLTLAFLGEVPEERVPELEAALGSVPRRAFTLQARGLGFFPSPRRPKVLWCGVEEDTGALLDLQAEVEAALAPLGFEADERDFHPHLTLGRSRDRRGDRRLATIAEDLGEVDLGDHRPAAFHLYRSELKPGGAVYTALAGWPLEGS